MYALGTGLARVEIDEAVGLRLVHDIEETCEKMGVPINAVLPSDTYSEVVEKAIMFAKCQKMAEENRR